MALRNPELHARNDDDALLSLSIRASDLVIYSDIVRVISLRIINIIIIVGILK